MQSKTKSKSLNKLEDTTYNTVVTIQEALSDLYNKGVENGTIGYSVGSLGQYDLTLDAIIDAFTDLLDELKVNPIPKEKLDTFDKDAFIEATGINFAVSKYAQRIDLIKENLNEGR